LFGNEIPISDKSERLLFLPVSNPRNYFKFLPTRDVRKNSERPCPNGLLFFFFFITLKPGDA